MGVLAVARRYADALADVAMERGLVDQIDGELRTLAGMLESSEELRDLFASPIVSLSDKQKVLGALIARAQPGELTANLLRMLLRNYRLHHLDAVYEQYGRVINARRGVVVARVTTAQPIDRADQEKLGSRLERMTGKRVRFEFTTDPELIGGVVTRIGSVVYDGSVRTQLREIQQKLKAGD